MANLDFGTILPGATESFLFDFTTDLAASGATITAAAWSVVVSPESVNEDATPGQRVIGTPAFTDTQTSCLIGTMVNGVIYDVTATVTLSDTTSLSLTADLECTDGASPEDETLTVEDFRTAFPAFKDTTAYPYDTVKYWINQATTQGAVNLCRAGQNYDLMVRLYVAHNLALNRMAEMQAAQGGAPIGAGIPASKSVGGVSISYDVEFGAEQDAGMYALTIWGNQFLSYLRMAGAAPIQL